MVYKPGASHHFPDFLSRASKVAPTEDIHDDIPCLALAETANDFMTGRYTGTDTPEPVEFDDVVEAQQTDDYCVEMTKRVERGTAKAFFLNEHHALYRRTLYGNQLVIPKSLRDRVLTLAHHATVAAHPGMNRMNYTMRKAYYWPSMVTDIHSTITKCTTCAQNRLALRRHTTPLTLFQTTEPMTELSVDIFGSIPASKRGNRFILVITDRFAKLTKCVALRRITAMSVASAIIDVWVSVYGPPDRILSDQGPQVMSNFFIAVMKMLGIETVRTTAYHLQTNGQVERYNRTMATQLRHYVADDPSRWDELLPVITMAYNGQPHRSTGIAPFELVIQRRIPNLTVSNLPPGTPLASKGTLKDGSPLARKREFMARLRYSAKVRWFDYGSKDDTWEPLDNLPRNMVVRFLLQKKRRVPGYDWQTPTRQSRRQAWLTAVTNVVVDPTWTPTIRHVHVTADGIIHADVSWSGLHDTTAIKEGIPVTWLRSTLPSMTRNFAYDPQLAFRQFFRLNAEYGPYTYVWPKASQSTLIKSDPTESVHPNGFFVPPVQHLNSVLRRLVSTKEEATVVIPQWTNTSWYATAIRACFEYQGVLSADARDTTPTPWAMLACHFLHRYDDEQETGKWTKTCQATETN